MALLIWLLRLFLLDTQSEATRPMAFAACTMLATFNPTGPACNSTCIAHVQAEYNRYDKYDMYDKCKLSKPCFLGDLIPLNVVGHTRASFSFTAYSTQYLPIEQESTMLSCQCSPMISGGKVRLRRNRNEERTRPQQLVPATTGIDGFVHCHCTSNLSPQHHEYDTPACNSTCSVCERTEHICKNLTIDVLASYSI